MRLSALATRNGMHFKKFWASASAKRSLRLSPHLYNNYYKHVNQNSTFIPLVSVSTFTYIPQLFNNCKSCSYILTWSTLIPMNVLWPYVGVESFKSAIQRLAIEMNYCVIKFTSHCWMLRLDQIGPCTPLNAKLSGFSAFLAYLAYDT